MPDDQGKPTTFELGQESGRISQVLMEYGKHFDTLNGSQADTARALTQLTRAIDELREEGRLAQERVKVAADTLEVETERRRRALADSADVGDRKFSRRERIGATVLTAALALVGYLGFGPR